MNIKIRFKFHIGGLCTVKVYCLKTGFVSASWPQDFGLHSCRRGAVSNAVNKGGDPFIIAKAMRVRTVGIVHHYAKVDNDNLLNMCNLVFA